MGSCTGKITAETHDLRVHRSNIVSLSILVAYGIITLSGAVYVLACNRQNEKPVFVKVLFSLLLLLLLVSTLYCWMGFTADKNVIEPDFDFQLWRTWKNVLFFLGQAINSIIHWIFAMKYFQLALSFPLLMGLVPIEQQERKKAQIKYTLLGFNIVFTLLVISILFVQLYSLLQSDYETKLFVLNILNIASKVCSAIILIFSIFRLRSMIKRTRHVGLTTRETIMTLHTVLFSLTIVALFLAILSYKLLDNAQSSQEECKIAVTDVWVVQFIRVTSLLTLSLIIHVANRVCTPLSQRWQATMNTLQPEIPNDHIQSQTQSLDVGQSKTLFANIADLDAAHQEEQVEIERARRYHAAARRDADLLIQILENLVHAQETQTTRDSVCVQSVSDHSSDERTSSLTTTERAALFDSTDPRTNSLGKHSPLFSRS